MAKCYRGGYQSGNGAESYDNGDIFYGGWKNGVKDGGGITVTSDGCVYDELWENGMLKTSNVVFDGHEENGTQTGGILVTDDESLYVGGLDESDSPQGVGIVKHKDSSDMYVGYFRDGEFDGYGMLCVDGVLYQGKFSEGFKHGNGIMTSENFIYEGEFEQDEFCGRGVMKRSDGSYYDGEWKDGEQVGQGYGKTILEDGSVYEGELVDGRFCGHGTVTKDGELIYDCEFDGGKPRLGFMKMEDGGDYRGEIDDFSPCGNGVMKYPNGDVYEGDWKDGLRDGSGVLRLADGGCYEGEFSDDEMSGEGTYTYPNGDVYEGEFVGGERDGFGLMTFSNGYFREGEWDEGEMTDETESTNLPDAFLIWPDGTVREIYFDDFDEDEIRTLLDCDCLDLFDCESDEELVCYTNSNAEPIENKIACKITGKTMIFGGCVICSYDDAPAPMPPETAIDILKTLGMW